MRRKYFLQNVLYYLLIREYMASQSRLIRLRTSVLPDASLNCLERIPW